MRITNVSSYRSEKGHGAARSHLRIHMLYLFRLLGPRGNIKEQLIMYSYAILTATQPLCHFLLVQRKIKTKQKPLLSIPLTLFQAPRWPFFLFLYFYLDASHLLFHRSFICLQLLDINCQISRNKIWVLSLFRQLQQNTTDWAVYKKQKYIPCCSDVWESKIKVPAQFGESLFLGHRFLIMSSPGGRGKGALLGLFYKDINLITSQRPCLLISPHWAMGFQYAKLFIPS